MVLWGELQSWCRCSDVWCGTACGVVMNGDSSVMTRLVWCGGKAISGHIKAYRGISRHIEAYQGISRNIEAYQGISRHIGLHSLAE